MPLLGVPPLVRQTSFVETLRGNYTAVANRGRPPKGFTPTSDVPELLEYWNLALASPQGIAIESQNPNRLVQKLYAARRECGHLSYNGLRVVECETEVWICPR